MSDSILIVGGGGREHALAWKLSQSPLIKHIYVSPGNAGTESCGNISNCNVDVKNHSEVSKWCQANNITLVVVGPEDPLANGLADHLKNNDIKCFGPCQMAAQIEASKEFAKQFMDQYEIPTAHWKSFTDAEEAKRHIVSAPYKALVVKASGLAAGKGVIVASSREEAVKAVDTLKEDKGLFAASNTIVIEEMLSGEEVSVLCFSDGTNISVMPPAQDHKRLLDDDMGPNTGGMGAYCRCPFVQDTKEIEINILQKVVDGMKANGTPFVGVIYAGLMLTENGPKVLEFNCRFGDPETQVILPMLQTDLYSIMLACVKGSLDKIDIKWSLDKYAVGVVLVSEGYPGSYPKGKIISGLNESETEYIVFHAGTTRNSGNILTSGGRVLAVVALGNNLKDAVSLAKKGCEAINFEGKFYRSDIAKKAFIAKRNDFEGITYKSAGVDIDSADDLVKKIKALTKETVRSEVCGGIGGFGGIFELSAYNDPYLVSTVNNIGEKLKVAQECSKYESVGYDLVASAVNEIISHGAEPLFFLDTYTCGKLNTEVAAKVIAGIAKGCKESNCTLIGGETAEMPGMYSEGDFDLTAFARGAVEKPLWLPKKKDICDRDIVIGLLSSSLNFTAITIVKSLINKLDLTYNSAAPFNKNLTLGEVLLHPNTIYVKALLPLLKKGCVKCISYLMKNGLSQSLETDLPEGYSIVLDAKKWNVPPAYDWITSNTYFSEKEMIENFNFGIDLLLVVDKNVSENVLNHLESHLGRNVASIGVIKKCLSDESKVKILNHNHHKKYERHRKRIAILTSHKGKNFQSLFNYVKNPVTLSDYEISLVISDTNCENIQRAKDSSICTKVISEKESSSSLSMIINEVLTSHSIDLVCLDSFQIKFSKDFLKVWEGRILNIHSSLLPSFYCPDPCKEALSLQTTISGCTVYLEEEEDKFGKIIAQDALRIDPNSTAEILLKNIQHLQQFTYPKALEILALNKKGKNSISSIYHSSAEDLQKLHEKIKCVMQSTSRPGFEKYFENGLFDLKAAGYKAPYLVSGTDGVGTKLKIAQTCNIHDTIGIDLVAMCVNDILTHGAEPLFFLQSFDCGTLNSQTALSVISGIADGCKQANCALIGSEINELPDIYFNLENCIQEFENYDVVGYAEGTLKKENLLPRLNDINEDDIVIGVASSGVHSNGYSLVRKIVELKHYNYNDPFPLNKTISIGEALLTPTKIYVKSVLPLMKQKLIKAAAHITGGGLTENIPRVLPSSFKVVLDGSKWDIPLVLQWIAEEGRLSEKEMLKTFNCGIGMALIVEKKNENEILTHLKNCGEKATTIGFVKRQNEGDDKVEIKFELPFLNTLEKDLKKKRVGVLISGSGTNLQALIDYTQNPYNCSSAEIVLVISNVPDVEGLKRAQKAGIQTKVLSHKGYKKRVEFDMAVYSLLKEANVEIVCLAGFMRILSKEFVQLWQGKLLNVHPAILPAFKGVNAHKQALGVGVKITGCSVHFVEPEVDGGAIIEQAAVIVNENETEETLQEKVKVLEHTIFPKALELLASGRIYRGSDGKLIRNR